MIRIISYNDRLGTISAGSVHGDPCRCGSGFAARHDTGLCEWCTAGLPPGRQYRNYPADYPLPRPAKPHAATYIRNHTGFTADPEETS